jgi:hypothetical protein
MHANNWNVLTNLQNGGDYLTLAESLRAAQVQSFPGSQGWT